MESTNEREAMLRRLSALSFAMWELHIFLDTHNCDKEAMRKLEAYAIKYKALLKEYESKFGQLILNISDANNNTDCNNRWAWTQGPWPWEDGKEC